MIFPTQSRSACFLRNSLKCVITFGPSVGVLIPSQVFTFSKIFLGEFETGLIVGDVILVSLATGLAKGDIFSVCLTRRIGVWISSSIFSFYCFFSLFRFFMSSDFSTDNPVKFEFLLNLEMYDF